MKLNCRASGISLSVPPLVMKIPGVYRAACKGWTKGVARRNRDFLQSVQPDSLGKILYGVTLTFADDPGPEFLKKQLAKFRKRMMRNGLVRMHWLVEWTERGVPHLHAILQFKSPWQASNIKSAWLDINPGLSVSAQKVTLVDAVRGWLQYLTKHGIRGVDHYQRQTPEKWASPGRMWGKSGVWKLTRIRIELSDKCFYALRRVAIKLARLKNKKFKVLSYTPWSCWISSTDTLRFIRNLSWQDNHIHYSTYYLE